MIVTHAKVMVKSHSVQKLVKQTDRRMDAYSNKQTEYFLGGRVVGKCDSGHTGCLCVSRCIVVIDARIIQPSVDSAHLMCFLLLFCSGCSLNVKQRRVALQTVVVLEVVFVRDVVVEQRLQRLV